MTPMMRAVQLTDQGLHVGPRPRPVVEPACALIRVILAGICSTDLELLRGYKGGFRGVLGHEFVGVVQEAPDHPHWIGQRVVGEINVGCGTCDLCRDGLGKHCRGRTTLGIIDRDGAFADFLVLPVANLYPVPDGVPDVVAVFAEPLAAALQIREQVHIPPSQVVYQLGSGRLGQLVAQVLAATGCDLTIVGRSPRSLALAASLSGARTVSIGDEAYAELRERRAPVVVDVTGAKAGFFAALDLVRPGGTLILKSTLASSLDDVDMSRLVVDEITLLGSRCGPFAPAVRALAAETVAVAPLVTRIYPITQAKAAFEHARQPGALKVLLSMDSSVPAAPPQGWADVQ